MNRLTELPGRGQIRCFMVITSISLLYAFLFLLSLCSLNEILAPSSDEEEEIRQAEERKKALEAKTKKTEPECHRRRQGLAAELERAASVSGLSRRSKRSLLRRGLDGGESSDEVDEDFDDESGLNSSFLFVVKYSRAAVTWYTKAAQTPEVEMMTN